MDKPKIFLKGKDKTSDISHFERCGRYHILVTFKNGKQFKYNLNNIKIVAPKKMIK